MVAGLLVDLYHKYEESLPYADTRTKDWPLINRTPVYVWTCTGLYLLIILLGPRLMSNRRPLELRGFLRIYNFGLVLFSLYMLIEILLSSWDAGYSYICHPFNQQTHLNPKELRVAKVLWWYFFSKVIEFVDTFCMILRKKNNQITFLHVYHHVSMFNIWWWVMMFIPGGQSLVGPLLNSLIHVIMYSYYFLSSFPSLQGKLWWKRYLTRLQLGQFSMVFVHSFYTLLSSCDFPKWGAYLLSGYMISLIFLFVNFYMRTYRPKTIADVKNEHTSIGAYCNVKNGPSDNNEIITKKIL